MFYGTAGGNVRGFYPGTIGDGQVLEYFYLATAQGSGVTDGDTLMSRTGGTAVTMRNVVIAPNWTASVGAKGPGHIGTGGIVTPTPITPWTIQNFTTYNCLARTTQTSVTTCAFVLSEAQAGFTGISANYQGNLIYGENTFSPNAIHSTGSNASSANNTLTPGSTTFNGCYIRGSSCGSSSVWGATNGTTEPPWTGAAGNDVRNFGTHYDMPVTGGAVPGANDLDDVNPGYIAHDRTMETYVVSRGGTGTANGVKDYWSGLQTSQLEAQLTSAFTYLYYGWTPFNIRYARPSSTANGKYLGAVRPTLFFGTF